MAASAKINYDINYETNYPTCELIYGLYVI